MWNYNPIRDVILRELNGKGAAPVPPFDNVFRTQNSLLSGTSANFPNPVYYPNPYLSKVIVQNPVTNTVALELGYGSANNLNPPAGNPSNLPYTVQPGGKASYPLSLKDSCLAGALGEMAGMGAACRSSISGFGSCGSRLFPETVLEQAPEGEYLAVDIPPGAEKAARDEREGEIDNVLRLEGHAEADNQSHDARG